MDDDPAIGNLLVEIETALITAERSNLKLVAEILRMAALAAAEEERAAELDWSN